MTIPSLRTSMAVLMVATVLSCAVTAAPSAPITLSSSLLSFTYEVFGDEIEFVVTCQRNAWVAIGVGNGGAMVQSPNVKAMFFLPPATFSERRLQGKSTGLVTADASQDFSAASGSQTGGVTSFQFRRKLVSDDPSDRTIVLDTPMTVLWAVGSTNTFAKHLFKGSTTVTFAGPDPSPTASPSSTRTSSHTPSQTPSPSSTPSHTPSHTPSSTGTPSPGASKTPSSTSSPSPVSATPSGSASATPSPSATPNASPSASPSATPSPAAGPVPTTVTLSSQVSFAYTIVGDSITFDVTSTSVNKWVAIGFSTSSSMISSPPAKAVFFLGTSTIEERVLNSKSIAGVPTDSSQDITATSGSKTGSGTTYSFTRKLVSDDSTDLTIPTDGSSIFVLWGVGPSNSLSQHSSRGARSVTFTSGCSRAGTCSGNGDCTPSDTCSCDTGYTGASCDTCADGFSLSSGSCVAGSVSFSVSFDPITTLSSAADRTAFVNGLTSNLASALGISSDRVTVTLPLDDRTENVAVGIGAGPAGEPSVTEAFDEFTSQLANPSSALLTGSVSGDLATTVPTPSYSQSVAPVIPDTVSVALSGDTMGMEYSLSADDMLTVRVTLAQTAWLALGFSSNSQMPDSNAVVGEPGSGTVRFTTISSRSAAGITNTASSISGTDLRQEGGNTVMTFTIPLAQVAPSGARTVLWAHGSSNSFGQHARGSRGALNVDFRAGSTSGVDRRGIEVAHGTFMFMGWGVLLPVGVLLARFVDRGGKVPWWFRLHVAFQCIGLLMGLIGFGIALDMVDGDHFEVGHAVLGMIVTVIGILQPVNAFFRPHPGPGTKRKVWEFLHKGFGYVGVVLGLVTVASGLNTIEPKANATVRVVYLLWGGFIIIFWILLSIAKKATTKPASGDVSPTNGATSGAQPRDFSKDGPQGV